MILGIDEAGRGAVMGPLVIAGVVVDAGAVLDGLKLKDSKELSPTKRRWLFQKIMAKARCHVKTVEADNIDDWRQSATMNEIEADMFNSIYADVFAGERGEHLAFVDAFDSHIGNLLNDTWSPLVRTVAEHHADSKYPIVSAASIVAKVWRDMQMMVIERTLGEWIGSGYPADPETIGFMQRWLDRGRTLPKRFVRYSWKTTERMLERHGRTKDWPLGSAGAR